MPIIESKGAGSAQGFGEFAQQIAATYIEDVFSTYLYNGTGANQTITNGIDLAGKGGFVWIKSRSNGDSNCLFDTQRGAGLRLISNLTNAQYNTGTETLSSFDSTGFSLGNDVSGYGVNRPSNTYASWTFRKQPKFFDVITYTGNGLSSNVISHNLGSVPGFIICKRTDSTSGWAIWHRGNGTTSYGLFALNTTDAATANFSTAPTSTTFNAYNIWDTGNPANASGGTYVAYLFAHNAGGFGLTGTDNVISCGSYVGTGSYPLEVTVGYEPQWLLVKRAIGGTSDWYLLDTMRGMVASGGGSNDKELYPNSSVNEQTSLSFGPTATGFTVKNVGAINNSGDTYIYIAIRRGPMKVPTDATKVFAPVVSSVSSGTQITAGFPVDMQIFKYRAGTVNNYVVDRLRGVGTTTTATSTPQIITNTTDAEVNTGGIARNWDNTSFAMPSGFGGISDIFWNFGRAPSFFDEVCYTGTGSTSQTVNHNLGVTPELIIYKRRNSAGNWPVAASAVGFTKQSNLNLTDNFYTNYDLTATSSTLLAVAGANANTGTYVAYLFATCAGVSKVGSYTGTGATQTISCGFAGGARFVLIKRTDSTGDWYVWDTARGMVSGTDPSLLLNSTAAEVNANSIYTATGGFQIVSTAAGINASGGTYIFLAIA